MNCLVIILLVCFHGILGITVNDIHCTKDENEAVKYGSTVEILSDTYGKLPDITRCMVKINNNFYELYPKNNLTNSHSPASVFVNATLCKVVIENFPFDYGGKWSFHVSTSAGPGSDQVLDTKDENFCKIVVEETRRMLPARAITVPSDTEIVMSLDDVFDEMTDCILIKTFYSDYPSTIYNLTTSKSVDGVERYGKCGFRMKVTSEWVDYYELRSLNGEYKVKKARCCIKVRNSFPMTFRKYEKVAWHRGSKANISIAFDSAVKRNLELYYCEWIQPDGQIVVTNQYECNYEVERVSKAHSGIWKCRIRVPDVVDFEEAEVEVKVEDPLSSIETSVHVTPSSITLICRTQFLNFDFCVFTMPSGTTINLSQGVITSKYEYFGRGYSDSDFCRYGSFWESEELAAPQYSECGLKINNPTFEDNGGWKCTMAWRDDRKPLSSFLLVNSNITADVLNVSGTDKVYVKRGNDFKMKCSLKAKLSYCFFQGPDWTVYPVTAKENSSLKNSLKYIGSSLNNGECEVLVKASENRHNGEWKCKLGIEQLGKEVEKKINVKVRAQDLITDARQIINTQTKNVDYILFSCYLGPEIDDSIKYCRWTCSNPNHSFFLEKFDVYSTSFNSTSCHLQIKNDRFTILPGNCNCYAGLTIDSDEELFGSI